MSKLKVHDIATISTDPSFHGWPTVARRSNGELLVVASGGRERHVCPFGQVHMIRSSDNGETWSNPQVLVNGPLDDRDAGVLETSQGTILVNWFTSVAWMVRLTTVEKGELTEPDESYLLRAKQIRSHLTEEVIRRELGTWMIRSRDGGGSWSQRTDTVVNTPHGPIELSDGRLLYVGRKRDDQRRPCPKGSPFAPQLGAAGSADEGESWGWLGGIPPRPGDDEVSYSEPHPVEASDGRIIVHVRNHNEANYRELLQCESSDAGRTWSSPHPTGIWGFPAHLLRLRDSRLLTTYGYRKDPFGNRACVSDDCGRTWSEPMTISQDEQHRDLGYPSTVELDDGTLLTVWYEQLPGTKKPVLRQARWSLID